MRVEYQKMLLQVDELCKSHGMEMVGVVQQHVAGLVILDIHKVEILVYLQVVHLIDRQYQIEKVYWHIKQVRYHLVQLVYLKQEHVLMEH